MVNNQSYSRIWGNQVHKHKDSLEKYLTISLCSLKSIVIKNNMLKKETIMVSENILNEAIQRLVKAYQPLKIYLYGDYAWGTPNEESAVDLLIIVDSSNERILKRGYAAFEALLGLSIPKNVSVFTKDEFDKYSQDPTSSTFEIKTRGKVLYAHRRQSI